MKTYCAVFLRSEKLSKKVGEIGSKKKRDASKLRNISQKNC